MATERLPGNEGLVGRWEQDEHRRAFADPANAYFLGHMDGAPIGFVIVQDWASNSGWTLIRRIIVAERAKKSGRELLSRVIDAIFAETQATRVWLNVFPHNERAQRAYRAIGFGFEDRAKYAATAGHSASLLMVLQRAEWKAEAST